MIDLSKVVVEDWNLNVGNPFPMPTSWRFRISADSPLGLEDYEAVNVAMKKKAKEDPAWRPKHVKVRVLDDGTVEIVEYTT